MDDILKGATRFRCDVFPSQQELHRRLARDGQHPQALMISCSDSRVPPELITQSGPGDLFVCRNAGNVAPPYGEPAEGVGAAVEYAVTALGVRHIVVCGHSDCGAMKGLLQPESLAAVPAVASWLRHARAAGEAVRHACADAADADRLAALVRENVRLQLAHLRTHPAVARGLAEGRLTLHGWVFDQATGEVEALDGARDVFVPLEDGDEAATPAASRPARALVRAELIAAE